MVNMQGYKVVPFSSFHFYESRTQMFNSYREQSPLLFSLGSASHNRINIA